jgi:hypothetical protein
LDRVLLLHPNQTLPFPEAAGHVKHGAAAS